MRAIIPAVASAGMTRVPPGALADGGREGAAQARRCPVGVMNLDNPDSDKPSEMLMPSSFIPRRAGPPASAAMPREA